MNDEQFQRATERALAVRDAQVRRMERERIEAVLRTKDNWTTRAAIAAIRAKRPSEAR